MLADWFVPPVFRPLLAPARFKSARGGRGSGKSHFFAGLAVIRMMEGKNILCVREVQNTIADSVKRLLEGKIEEFGWQSVFRITEREIECTDTGAVAIFRGMQNHTAASVKSLEGFDIAWWEEAQTASQRSLDLLIPTIRTPGSELWFSLNPENEDDPIEKLLVHEPPAGAVVVTANWQDNPRFPEELRGDMERDRERDPDKYAHIWEGAYRTASEARIFRNFREGDIAVPANAAWFYGVDWGFSVDPTVGVRVCFPDERTLYVSDEVYEVGVPTERLPMLLSGLPGMAKWPAAADSARPETIDYVRRHGFPRLAPAIKGPGSIEDGITFLQGFDIVISPRCPNVLNDFRKYAYKTDKKTGAILPVADDPNADGPDAVRYACERAHVKGKLVRGVAPVQRKRDDYGAGREDDDTDSWRVA